MEEKISKGGVCMQEKEKTIQRKKEKDAHLQESKEQIKQKQLHL